MKKIAVVTATRAEYGLLEPVVNELREYENDEFLVKLIVTGTHLKDNYGKTINEIKSSGVRIDEIIDVSVNSKTDNDISRNQADTLIKFSELFFREKFNAVILLGDRYETLAIAIAAGNTKTPIFHLCGGDTTEGAIDEWIRHSITKMSYLHFVTNEDSRKRVIQLGENPDRVFNYGSTSIDNIFRIADMSKNDALVSAGLKECKYALCTYHPVTMETNDVDYYIDELLNSIKQFPDIQFIVTKSNADHGGARINQILDETAKTIANLHVFASLGVRRYLSLMRYAEFVIGNSSSGIIETPSFHIPTVNIGDRQKGRLRAESIIDCETDKESICMAIKKALNDEYKKKCSEIISPYGNGKAAKRIASKSVEIIMNGKIDLKKSFYNLDFRV